MEHIFGKIKRMSRKLDGKRITAKLMSAVLIASSMLNAFGPVAAYAAEPELATVSLSETEHGKLAFDGPTEHDAGRRGRHRRHRGRHAG